MDNEMINNAVEEIATETVADAVTDQVVNNPSFFEKHPYAGLVADGAALGAGVFLGSSALLGAGLLIGKGIDLVKNKVVKPMKAKHDSKKAAKKTEAEKPAEDKPAE